MFEDGIVYIRLSGVTTYESLLSCLFRSLSNGPAAISERVKTCSDSYRMKERSRNNYINSTNKDDTNNTNNITNEDNVRDTEERLIYCLSSAKVLLVLDHINDLLSSSNGESITDFRMFLGQLFERCRFIKVCIKYTNFL